MFAVEACSFEHRGFRTFLFVETIVMPRVDVTRFGHHSQASISAKLFVLFACHSLSLLEENCRQLLFSVSTRDDFRETLAYIGFHGFIHGVNPEYHNLYEESMEFAALSSDDAAMTTPLEVDEIRLKLSRIDSLMMLTEFVFFVFKFYQAQALDTNCDVALFRKQWLRRLPSESVGADELRRRRLQRLQQLDFPIRRLRRLRRLRPVPTAPFQQLGFVNGGSDGSDNDIEFQWQWVPSMPMKAVGAIDANDANEG